MGVSVDIDLSEITANLKRLGPLTRNAVKNYLDDEAVELENYMKTHAPWKDRTGNARRGLTAESYIYGTDLGITLKYTGIKYDIYLEYGMELRFSIVEPTVRLKSPEVMAGLQGLLGSRWFKFL